MFAALIATWESLNFKEFKQTENEIFVGLCSMAVISLVFLKSGSGYKVNGTGFQGVLNHPQSFGVMLSITSAWLVARVLTRKKFPWFSLITIFICLLLTLRTECRTAGLALLMATICASIIKLIIPKSFTYASEHNILTRRLAILSVSCIIPLLILGTVFSESLRDYLLKRSNDSTNIVNIYMEARGGLIDTMLFNVKQHPYTGIGFGIASDPASMVVYYDPYFHLPVSAAIEKGVLPVAVLEETGIIGFIIFLVIISGFIISATYNGLPQLLVLLTVLFTNLAEYTFFSPGGTGMLLILVIAWSISRPIPQFHRQPVR